MVNENFNEFGPTFQSKIISSLLSDNKFIQTISDILEPTYFDSDANKWLTKEIAKYFMEFRKAPTLEVLKVKINQMDDEILKVSVVENLKEAWRNIESTDLEFVKQETLGFCKNQVLKGAIVDAVDLLEQKHLVYLYFFLLVILVYPNLQPKKYEKVVLLLNWDFFQ